MTRGAAGASADGAIVPSGQAFDMTSPLHTALQHHRGGRRLDAERCCREALEADPSCSGAAFLLGLLALEDGKPADAVPWLALAAELDPRNPACYVNLGEAHRRLGQLAPAFKALLQAIDFGPWMFAPAYNLGLLLTDCGALEGAVACFERAMQIKPGLKEASERLATVRALQALRPDSLPPAAGMSASVLVALATLQLRAGHAAASVALLRRALTLQPNMHVALAMLGSALGDQDRDDEAIEAYERAIELGPCPPWLIASLGNACLRSGRVREAIARHREAAALAPTGSSFHSSLLYVLQFDPVCNAREYLREALEWDARHGRPSQGARNGHENDRTPDRRLRVGYVGAGFRRHCQALFLLPLLSNHDRDAFEIFCYSNDRRVDDVTKKIGALADGWRDVVLLEDDAVVKLVRDDQIDVLVDLTMHMEGGRLPVFARKPAPIQLTWLAYPGTTGVSALHYRVTDPFLDPPDADTAAYSERLLHLPDAFWCYDPLTSKNALGPPPLRRDDRFTFGCLNNFAKLNEGVIALWSRILRSAPSSRLILRAPEGSARRRATELFQSLGVSSERIEFVGYQPRLDYLATYYQIDVCLDTFPYNGHTTSLDAFWMGVPVVTLVGETVVGRGGISVAMNLGLPQLVAHTPDDFVRIASELCHAPDDLAHLRAGLASRIEASPLMNAPRFARNLEAAYRRVWKEWCSQSSP